MELTEQERRMLFRLVRDCLQDQTHSEASLTVLFELKKKLIKPK